VANSYARLANLSDEDEPPKKASALASLSDEEQETAAPVQDDLSPHTEDESTGEWWKRELKALTHIETWKRPLKLAARSAVDSVESLPLTAMDMGVSARNMITGSNYEMPSQMNSEALNTVLPHPETFPEKLASFVGGAVAGAKLPAPQAAKQAPVGFVPPNTSPTAAIAREAQAEGFVLPPATASTSIGAKLAESVAGKASTAQAASIKNQELTNELARKALGLKSGTQITPNALESIRETAGKVYAQIADAGEIVPDGQYLDDLAQLGRSADEIAQSFPGSNVGATKQVEEMVGSLLQNKFDSKAALQYLRELRKMSTGNLSGMNAADPAKQALGMAQREAAATLEDLIGRHLTKIGKADVAESFAGARKMIAMTYSVEKALNETTGNVVAGKLGQQLAKGKPLSGELEIAARFSRAFPKAAKEVTESMPGASPLDWIAGGLISAGSGNPAGMLLAGVRPTMREFLMSSPGQRMFAEKAIQPFAGPQINLGAASSAAMQLAREVEE
jgi:hypothetical protein